MSSTLDRVSLETKSLEPYAPIVGDQVVSEIHRLAADLKGIRLLHLNSTATAGGVAEILASSAPLEADCGIDVEWWILCKNERFFEVTKKIHNGLQSQAAELSQEEQKIYLEHNAECAKDLAQDYDVVIVHDPQPAAIHEYVQSSHSRWIWRCHIDTSQPSPQIWKFLHPFIQKYDAAIFTLKEFIPPDFAGPKISIIPPAIDPLSSKNRDMPEPACRQIASKFGIDPSRPLIVQASRFDPWKDPEGVIEAYRIIKKNTPKIQLALIGAMAEDDPEGWRIYKKICKEQDRDPDIHIIKDLIGERAHELNAFQRVADVAVQKSLREGFGLVVSEALWKETPVVGGNTGGIRLQLKDGIGGFLVNSVPEAAERIEFLLTHAEEAQAMAKKGREHVRQNFLLPRLILDELKLVKSVASHD